MVDITNITFYINHLKDAPIGSLVSLPGYIMNNHGLQNVSADENLCFFRCLAVHWGANPSWCEKATKYLFYKYCVHFGVVPGDFAGVQLFDFTHLEDFFELNLIAYELDDKVAKLVQRSFKFYQETMRLNIFGNHLSVIVDFEIMVCTNAFTAISCGITPNIIINTTKVAPKQCVRFFLGGFTKILPLFLKNWRK